MEIKKLIETLHPLERKVLPILEKTTRFPEIVKESKLQEVEVMRALQWLQNKGIITLNNSYKELIEIEELGRTYRDNGLPEKKILTTIRDKPLSVDEIINTAHVNKDELNACTGILKEKSAITILKGDKVNIAITEQGKKLIDTEFIEDGHTIDLISIGITIFL